MSCFSAPLRVFHLQRHYLDAVSIGKQIPERRYHVGFVLLHSDKGAANSQRSHSHEDSLLYRFS